MSYRDHPVCVVRRRPPSALTFAVHSLEDIVLLQSSWIFTRLVCQIVDRIYSTELQLNRANSSDTEAPFLDLNLCISNGTVSTKIYDKLDDFDFDIVNSLFWMAMSPGVPHMGYTYLNLLDSPELLQILMTLTTVIKPLLPNFLGRAIVILNFVRRFRNFIADTVPC